MSHTANRINAYALRFNAAKYLEIGVREGKTFFPVKLPLKIAVDPNFLFDPGKDTHDGVLYFPITSDEFFAVFPEHLHASLYLEPDGHIAFDIIYIDGQHTFEQSLRDFENSRKFCHSNTLWIMDDTVPSDVFSTIPDQKIALECRKLAGGTGGAWHGDVFKTLFAIHDHHPDISYCTIMGQGNPQTLLWQAPPHSERKPHFDSSREIAKLSYLAVLDNADLFFPVNDELASALIGKSLAPVLYACDDTWKKMLYSKIISAGEVNLKNKVKELENKIAELEHRVAHSVVMPKEMER